MKQLFIHHPYQLVKSSPWPLRVAVALGYSVSALLFAMHYQKGSQVMLISSLLLLAMSVYKWFLEIFTEGLYKGEHTKIVQYNMLYGFIRFILSEIAVFVSLFISFFYHSLVPSTEMGCMWPPLGMQILNPESTPRLNTMVRYASGITVTMAQNEMSQSTKTSAKIFLLMTIMLGVMFSALQYMEYLYSTFDMSDGVYGSCFYMLTGCHGMHVLMGTTWRIVSLVSLCLNHFSNSNPLGLSLSSTYWHFVDYVWRVRYATLYTWGV